MVIQVGKHVFLHLGFTLIFFYFLAICRIENSSITTFDKMQYNFTMNHCEHVVMAVQSTESFAVLIRQEEAQRVINHSTLRILLITTVTVGSHVID